MSNSNPKNPEGARFKIEQTARGNWTVHEWVETSSSYFPSDWIWQARFKYRWQARRYIRKMFELPSKTEYHGDLK